MLEKLRMVILFACQTVLPWVNFKYIYIEAQVICCYFSIIKNALSNASVTLSSIVDDRGSFFRVCYRPTAKEVQSWWRLRDYQLYGSQTTQMLMVQYQLSFLQTSLLFSKRLYMTSIPCWLIFKLKMLSIFHWSYRQMVVDLWMLKRSPSTYELLV